MMHFNAVLALALVSTAAAATVSVSTSDAASTAKNYNMFGNAFNSVGSSLRSTIGLVNTTAHMGTKMTNDGVQGMTGAGQQMVNTVSGLASTGLGGGVDAAKHVIDIKTNLLGALPGVGKFAMAGGNVAKAKADVTNMAGQTGISMASGMENGKMKLVSGVTSAGTGMADKGINMGLGMASAGLETGLKVGNGIFGTVGNLVDTGLNLSNKVSGKVSTVANSITDKVSVSSPSGPSISVSGLLDKVPVSSLVNGVAVSGASKPTQGDSKVQVQVAA